MYIIQDLWYNIKRSNLCVTGISEEEREHGAQNIFEEIIVEDFPKWMTDNKSQIQKSQKHQANKYKNKQELPPPPISRTVL